MLEFEIRVEFIHGPPLMFEHTEVDISMIWVVLSDSEVDAEVKGSDSRAWGSLFLTKNLIY